MAGESCRSNERATASTFEPAGAAKRILARASILRYKAHELNFESDVITALVDCRELIMDAIDARTKQKAGNKQQEE